VYNNSSSSGSSSDTMRQLHVQVIECKRQQDVLTYSAESASSMIVVALVVQTQGKLYYHSLKVQHNVATDNVFITAVAVMICGSVAMYTLSSPDRPLQGCAAAQRCA
jgi:hypothetical protein